MEFSIDKGHHIHYSKSLIFFQPARVVAGQQYPVFPENVEVNLKGLTVEAVKHFKNVIFFFFFALV